PITEPRPPRHWASLAPISMLSPVDSLRLKFKTVLETPSLDIPPPNLGTVAKRTSTSSTPGPRFTGTIPSSGEQTYDGCVTIWYRRRPLARAVTSRLVQAPRPSTE